jgi:hypothetical protein
MCVADPPAAPDPSIAPLQRRYSHQSSYPMKHFATSDSATGRMQFLGAGFSFEGFVASLHPSSPLDARHLHQEKKGLEPGSLSLSFAQRISRAQLDLRPILQPFYCLQNHQGGL